MILEKTSKPSEKCIFKIRISCSIKTLEKLEIIHWIGDNSKYSYAFETIGYNYIIVNFSDQSDAAMFSLFWSGNC